jgi:hypothetical protein
MVRVKGGFSMRESSWAGSKGWGSPESAPDGSWAKRVLAVRDSRRMPASRVDWGEGKRFMAGWPLAAGVRLKPTSERQVALGLRFGVFGAGVDFEIDFLDVLKFFGGLEGGEPAEEDVLVTLDADGDGDLAVAGLADGFEEGLPFDAELEVESGVLDVLEELALGAPEAVGGGHVLGEPGGMFFPVGAIGEPGLVLGEFGLEAGDGGEGGGAALEEGVGEDHGGHEGQHAEAEREEALFAGGKFGGGHGDLLEFALGAEGGGFFADAGLGHAPGVAAEDAVFFEVLEELVGELGVAGFAAEFDVGGSGFEVANDDAAGGHELGDLGHEDHGVAGGFDGGGEAAPGFGGSFDFGGGSGGGVDLLLEGVDALGLEAEVGEAEEDEGDVEEGAEEGVAEEAGEGDFLLPGLADAGGEEGGGGDGFELGGAREAVLDVGGEFGETGDAIGLPAATDEGDGGDLTEAGLGFQGPAGDLDFLSDFFRGGAGGGEDVAAEEAAMEGGGEDEFALFLDDDEFVWGEFEEAEGGDVVAGLIGGEVIREGVGEDVDADDGQTGGLAEEMPAVGAEGAVRGAEAVAFELGIDHLAEQIVISHGQEDAEGAAGGGGEADDERGGHLAHVGGAFDLLTCGGGPGFP